VYGCSFRSQEHPLVLPLLSAQAITRHGTTCRISPSCASPVPPGSIAVRGSHVIRELLRVITPPISMSNHRNTLTPVAQVSVPRDSKASHLPGLTLHQSTNYQPAAGNGFITLHTATFKAAVTRLSYAVTLGFPRCRPSQISPPGPMAFLHTMTAYVCGKRRALTIRAVGRAGYLLSPHGRNNLYFPKLPVSVSPALDISISLW
jgi:hypothetical protein